MPLQFSVHQTSHIGARKRNEDLAGYSCNNEALLLALADGMGGHPRGQIAARIALEIFSQRFKAQANPTLADIPGFLTGSLMAAHQSILRYADEEAMPDAPRTTLVVAVVQGGEVRWLHCGDSRLYFLRQGALHLRTRDHSYADLARAGAISGTGPFVNRSVLFTCLGSPTPPIYDLSTPHVLMHGDRLLLCSDGLWAGLSDTDIARSLSLGNVEQAVQSLTSSALAVGGEHCDNVTAIGVEWSGGGIASPSAHLSLSVDSRGFASTIQAGSLSGASDDIDAAAIERAIAEINQAIDRSQSLPKRS